MKNISKFVLLALFLVLGMGASCKSSNTAVTPTANDFTNQKSTAVTSQTKTDLDKARVAAAGWKSDATWVALNFKEPADMNPKNLTQTFVFGSATDIDNWFTYSIDTNGKFVRAVIPKSDFLGSALQPIGEQYWKISYIEALQTADTNGGNAYKAKYPETETTITLNQTEPKNWVWYIIEYRSAIGNQKIRISANDGKIYNDQGNLVQ